MAVESIRNAVCGDEFEVEAQAVFFIENIFGDESRVDDIPLISRHCTRVARNGVRVEHASAEAKRVEILPNQDSFSKRQRPEARRRQLPQRRENSWNWWRAGPGAGR
jgi:hypothetical protein